MRIAAQPTFLQYTVELVSSNQHKDHRAAYELHRDWTMARCRLWAEIVTKLYYFRQLPWHLIGVAHHRRELAMKAARECLQLYDNVDSPGRDHRMSQRFLSHTFVGDNPSDVPLRPMLEAVVKGADLQEEEFEPLTKWLGRLAMIRMSERSVEGVHSHITRCFKRAPASSMAYVSIELRFGSVMRELAKTPFVACCNIFLKQLKYSSR